MPNQMLGLERLQIDALNRHLAAGVNPDKMGIVINALTNGLVESFQGKILFNTTGVFKQVGIVTADGPHYVFGGNQALAIRSSADAAAAGIPDASAGNEFGNLVLTNADTNGVAGCAVTQENVLWIPTAKSFSFVFDVNQWTNQSLDKTISFSQIGVMGNQATIANITDAAKEPADGNPFILVELAGGYAKLRIRTAASATVIESGVISLPTGSATLRVDYQYNPGGAAVTSIYVNGNRAVSVAGGVTGPLQAFARVCHGASYVAATHTPTILSVDSVVVSVPR